MKYHLYTDDTQLCITFNGADTSSRLVAIFQIELCVAEVKEWMLHNMLKLTGDKTEFLQFLTHQLKTSNTPLPSVNIGCGTIDTNFSAKIRVLLDHNLSLDQYIRGMVKAANFQLYHLRRIWKYLMPEALCIAV